MKRKKWTAKEEINEEVIRFREKRKWQIVLRRYILEKQPCSYYAPFFGLDIETFRNWIELQFDDELNWENFSTAWQFDHIVPLDYFSFLAEEDMKLCWNFVNIRVNKTISNSIRRGRIDPIAAKTHFQVLYKRTGFAVCEQMIHKIQEIEISQIGNSARLEKFIDENGGYLQRISFLNSYEYDQLNEGVPIDLIEKEREILGRFKT